MNTTTESSSSSPPLMFFLGELSGETKHAFFNPMNKALVQYQISELEPQLECLSTRYGWLLLLSRETSSLFFFNPVSHKKIQLPYRKSIFNAAAFSAPPTSPDCTVYAVVMPTFRFKLRVDTLRVGQEKRKWVRHSIRPSEIECSTGVQAVCCNGKLYLVDMHGRVVVFDGEDNSWTRIPGKCFERIWDSYFVEFNGDVYAGKKGGYGAVEKVFKLKIENGVSEWVEVEDVGGVSLFLGPHGSCALPVKGMENKVFVAGDGAICKFGVYNFSGGEVNEDEKFDHPAYKGWYVPVWINEQQPSNLK
ncbi:F-box protein At4g00893-like [Cornus florida]|uniref:F-box protein At4g00893-like n=1 Tax=Cornus florida TaxID=4283 RepID=UPI0028988D71|nr:F-box protein At4g00893-like [Cornus florida]